MAIKGLLKGDEGQKITERLLRGTGEASFLGWFCTFVFHTLLGPFRVIFYPIWAFLPYGSLSHKSFYRLLSVIITLPVAAFLLFAFLTGGNKALDETLPSRSLSELAETLRTVATASDEIRENGMTQWIEDVKSKFAGLDDTPPPGVASLKVNLGYQLLPLANGTSIRAHVITVNEDSVDLWLMTGSREQKPLSAFDPKMLSYFEAVRYQLGYR